MNKKNLIPLALFSLVFLLYSIYFVKVINHQRQLEPNSIARTVRRVMEQKDEKREVKSEERDSAPSPAAQPATTQESEKPDVRIPEVEELEPVAPVVEEPEVKEEPVEEEVAEPVEELQDVVQYVNYVWLNVREKPTLASPVIERLNKNDQVQVKEFTTASWAKVKTPGGTEGFVARRYLSEEPMEDTESSISAPSNVRLSGDAPDIYEVPIVTYYHITDETNKYPTNLTLAVKNFLVQLDWLVANEFETITFYDLKLMAEGKMKMTGKQLILTFSDGYADAYDVAQHLNGKGMKGVFYVITEKVGTEGYLDWRQIKKMRSWGMEIASSGVTAANLALSGDYYLNDELQRSKKEIEELLGEEIISFAYPSGGYNEKAMDAAAEAGYSFVRSLRSGSRYRANEFYQLPTLRVFPNAGSKQFQVWFGQ